MKKEQLEHIIKTYEANLKSYRSQKEVIASQIKSCMAGSQDMKECELKLAYLKGKIDGLESVLNSLYTL